MTVDSDFFDDDDYDGLDEDLEDEETDDDFVSSDDEEYDEDIERCPSCQMVPKQQFCMNCGVAVSCPCDPCDCTPAK